jgi:hypothetical protein
MAHRRPGAARAPRDHELKRRTVNTYSGECKNRIVAKLLQPNHCSW